MSNEKRRLRAEALYAEDKGSKHRKSHENPAIKQIYEEYLGEPLGQKSHKLLHTKYTPRSKDYCTPSVDGPIERQENYARAGTIGIFPMVPALNSSLVDTLQAAGVIKLQSERPMSYRIERTSWARSRYPRKRITAFTRSGLLRIFLCRASRLPRS